MMGNAMSLAAVLAALCAGGAHADDSAAPPPGSAAPTRGSAAPTRGSALRQAAALGGGDASALATLAEKLRRGAGRPGTDPAFPLKDTGKVCVADLGSNSLKLEIGEIRGGEYLQHHLEKRVAGVGDDMSASGRISESKLAEIGSVLDGFAETCRKHGAGRRHAVATAAYREAANGSAVVGIARERGFPLEVASGERESRLAYLSCTLGRPGRAVLDIGSRTVELATDGGPEGFRFRVLPLGYRVSYQGFFETAGTFREAASRYRAELARQLPEADFLRGKPELLGIELNKAARFLRGGGPVHGVKLTEQEIAAGLSELERLSAPEFEELKRRKDIDGALPRLVLLLQILRQAGYPSITVVDRELGAGVIAELAR